MIKTLRKQGIEPNFLTMSKGIDKNPTDSIILSGKRLKSFLLRSEKEQRYLPSLLLVNIVLEVLTRAVQQVKKNQRHSDWQGRSQAVSICRSDGYRKSRKSTVYVQLRGTLCNPMDCSPPGFCVHGILQSRILEWVAISSYRGSS